MTASIPNVWMTFGHVTKSPRLSFHFLSGRSKVMRSRKEGEPGNKATKAAQLAQ